MIALRKSTLLLAVLGIASCDPAYAPFLRNGLTSEIDMRVDYKDGTYSAGTLKPGERLVFGPKARIISHIVVSSKGNVLYDLDSEAIARLHGPSPDNRVTWIIGADGINPEGK